MFGRGVRLTSARKASLHRSIPHLGHAVEPSPAKGVRPRTDAWRQEGSPVRFLGVHPGPLLYTRVFLRLEPLGLELVAQAVRRAGHEVQLIDLQVEDHRAYFRMLKRWRPDAVAFSCNYLANVPEIVDLAKA